MTKRLRLLGIVLSVIGVGFLAGGGIAYLGVQDGYTSLEKFSEAQNVTLSYNDAGELVDRGTTEGAQAILSLLQDDWGYSVDFDELDPNDPLVNTDTEYMVQMATVGYHVLHGTQTIVLTEDAEYDGESFPAGEYTLTVNEVGSPERVAAGLGGYWTDFDRMHPLEGPARAQAWSGTAHGLFGELGVGTVTHSALQLGMALAGLFAGVGATTLLAGAGIIWATGSKDEFDSFVEKATKETTQV